MTHLRGRDCLLRPWTATTRCVCVSVHHALVRVAPPAILAQGSAHLCSVCSLPGFCLFTTRLLSLSCLPHPPSRGRVTAGWHMTSPVMLSTDCLPTLRGGQDGPMKPCVAVVRMLQCVASHVACMLGFSRTCMHALCCVAVVPFCLGRSSFLFLVLLLPLFSFCPLLFSFLCL